MATKCILPPAINRKLREAVESGKLKAEDLLKQGDERNAILEQYIGKDYAEKVGTRFAKKFNTELDEDTVQEIVNKMSEINKLRALDKTPFDGTSKEWARKYIEMSDMLGEKVNKSSTFKESISEELRKITDQPDTLGKISQGVRSTFDVITSPVYKSLKAAMDLSYALRQGFKVLTKSPTQWAKSMGEAFKAISSIGSKKQMDAVMREFKATYLSHPNYEKLVNEGKLAFGVAEDWFPTTIAEKIPVLGNAFKSSNDAFTIFSQSARFGLANDLLEKQIIANGGKELSKEQIKSIGFFVNSITGRGSLWKAEALSGALNKLFFSARYVRSQVDTFIMPFNQTVTPEIRAEALKHSLTTLGSIGAILATASAFGEVETDPRSSNFGKIKVPGSKSWIDLTAGLGSYVTLAAKQATGESKSSLTGKVTKLGDKYGAPTRADVIYQWGENKLAPAPSIIKQVVSDKELYGGKKPTPVNIGRQLIVPITADNSIEYLQNEDTATALLLMMADASGLGTKTTY